MSDPAVIPALAADLAARSREALLLRLPARSWLTSKGNVVCTLLEAVSTRQFKELSRISE